MDAFERHYVKDMKNHCDAEMRLPEGVSAEATFDKKKRLLLTVNLLRGSKEFESQKRKFVHHVEEFANRYGFPVVQLEKERIRS